MRVEINILYSICEITLNDQLVGVYSDRLNKRVLGTGQVKKGGLRHGSGSKGGGGS